MGSIPSVVSKNIYGLWQNAQVHKQRDILRVLLIYELMKLPKEGNRSKSFFRGTRIQIFVLYFLYENMLASLLL